MFSLLLADDGVYFPVPEFLALFNDIWPFINAGAQYFLVFTGSAGFELLPCLLQISVYISDALWYSLNDS